LPLIFNQKKEIEGRLTKNKVGENILEFSFLNPSGRQLLPIKLEVKVEEMPPKKPLQSRLEHWVP